MGIGTTAEGIRGVIRKNSGFFFDKAAIRESYGNPYTEVIRRAVFQWGLALQPKPYTEAIRKICFDIYFYIKIM